MARKITEQSVEAFLNGQRFRKGNTQVIIYSDGIICLVLHGNIIARRTEGENDIEISCAGWWSNTTKERLNGLLDNIGRPRIYQRDFVWYRGEQEVPYDQFFSV